MMCPVCYACEGLARKITNEKCVVCGGAGALDKQSKPCKRCRHSTYPSDMCGLCKHGAMDHFEAKT